MNNKEERISKERAIKLWDSGKINDIEVGTLSGLQAIHSLLFQDFKRFQAGKIRQSDISKGNFRFASSLYINEASRAVEALPEDSLDEIIDKYTEMNILHPFIDGNGRTTRIWLDLILKKQLNLCIDWRLINKQDYLSAMEMSPINSNFLKTIIGKSLTNKIDDRTIYMKGIDRSYEYENLSEFDIDTIDEEMNDHKIFYSQKFQ